MGIDNRRLYALAMALSLGIVAVAGVFLGVRTTLRVRSGPDRLIFAFEAVIIGGLGSLWGTLVGGMVLGVAQTVGASSRRLGHPHRPPRLPRRAARCGRQGCSRGSGGRRD